MARSYAKLVTALWARGSEFRHRSPEAQRVYLMLVSQSDISACGVLALRLPRWANNAPGVYEHDVRVALKELEAHRYIVVDEAASELLVRSFTRHDGGYTNPRRLPSIRDAADEVVSEKIVAVLAEEFERLDIAERWRGQASTEWLSIGKNGTPPDPHESDPDEAHADVYEGPWPTEPPDGDGDTLPGIDAQVNSHSIGGTRSEECLSPSQRRVPQPTTHNPQPVPPEHGDPPAKKRTDPRTKVPRTKSVRIRLPDDFPITDEMRQWAQERAPLVDVDLETEIFINHWRGNGETKVDWLRTWWNWMLKADGWAKKDAARSSNGRANGKPRFTTYRNPDDPKTAYAGYKPTPGDDHDHAAA